MCMAVAFFKERANEGRHGGLHSGVVMGATGKFDG